MSANLDLGTARSPARSRRRNGPGTRVP